MVDRIDSKTARARLKPRNAPYWHRLRVGVHLGYRAVAAGEGTWCAKLSRLRAAGGGEERFQKTLGEIVERDGGPRAFTVASEQAQAWVAEIERGVVPHALTLRDVCDQHVKAIRRTDTKKAARTEADFRRLIDDTLGRIELGKLKRGDLEGWRDRMAAAPARLGRGKRTKTTPRAPATINRDLVPLRAALNRALDADLVSSDLAWRVALRPIKNADRRRDIYLDRKERKRLLEKAGDEIRPFLRALTLLPLRPGALAALTVADFDGRRKMLRVGRDKAGAERRITLPDATTAFLVAQAKGKLPGAPLISTAAGGRWSKDRWKGPIREAVTAAKLPAATTAYTLRHSVITDLVAGGLPVLTVAQISGTSVAMIEKHYGHLQQEQAAAALARLVL